ncbi:plasmid partitioning protein RepB C-terminal domain-containing protein [Caulobacter sp. CCG-8]|uniref:plasmid partitioning protein RepB C-terminal domain-containing protein n=1 Tax=Caulobacter sp. CCG-8 TaxID=3127958 RepID=UPI00307DA72D
MNAVPKIELIPIDQIEVINPRGRNKKGHGEIIDNISLIGLKRPIKVSRRAQRDGRPHYSLICGQGRLEAFQALGQEQIPAIVVEANEADCLVESLVENVARRQHRAIDLMQEVGSMRKRGYSDSQIANKIGVTSSWVCMIAGLLERGEGRLVAAVETGLIPLSFAVEIAKVDDAEAQQALADAYEEGKIKGAKIGVVRRLLDQRARRRRAMPDSALGRKNPSRGLTGDQLVKLYQKETDRQRVLVKKADYAQSRLLFVIEALKELRSDESFVAILGAEQLLTMPRGLTERMGVGR